MVAPLLPQLRSKWSTPGSVVSVSLLLELTNKVLLEAAIDTQRSHSLKHSPTPKSIIHPKVVKLSKQKMNASHRAYKKALSTRSSQLSSLKSIWIEAKKSYRKIVRLETHKVDLLRDSELFSLLSSSSSKVFRKIRASRKSSASNIPFLMVGDT